MEFLKRKNIEISVQRYLIDAMGAMAQGLFASLLIGTIVSTLGTQLGIELLVTVGNYAKAVVGPAMAVSIGYALQAPPLVLFSLAAVGTSANELGGAGGPLAVLVIAIIAAEFGKAVSKETKIDIIVTPFVTVFVGVGLSLWWAPGNRRRGIRRGFGYHVGNGITAVFYGNSRICVSRNCTDAANQQRRHLHGAWTYRSGWRSGVSGMLCPDGRLCRVKFPGKWLGRSGCPGHRHIDVADGKYRKESAHLAAGDFDIGSYRTDCHLRVWLADEWTGNLIRNGNLRTGWTDRCLHRLAC